VTGSLAGIMVKIFFRYLKERTIAFYHRLSTISTGNKQPQPIHNNYKPQEQELGESAYPDTAVRKL
jgi:hypothetical protein